MTTHDRARTDEGGIDRRKLLLAGAWAAPVMVLAAAVPAATASPTGVPFSDSTLNVTQDGRKLTVKISGTASGDFKATLVVTNAKTNGNPPDLWANGDRGDATQLKAGSTGYAEIEFPTFTKKDESGRTWVLTIRVGDTVVYTTGGTY